MARSPIMPVNFATLDGRDANEDECFFATCRYFRCKSVQTLIHAARQLVASQLFWRPRADSISASVDAVEPPRVARRTPARRLIRLEGRLRHTRVVDCRLPLAPAHRKMSQQEHAINGRQVGLAVYARLGMTRHGCFRRRRSLMAILRWLRIFRFLLDVYAGITAFYAAHLGVRISPGRYARAPHAQSIRLNARIFSRRFFDDFFAIGLMMISRARLLVTRRRRRDFSLSLSTILHFSAVSSKAGRHAFQ